MASIKLTLSETLTLILFLERELKQSIKDDVEVAKILNEKFPETKPHRNPLTETKITILNKLEDGRGDRIKQEVIKSLTDEA